MQEECGVRCVPLHHPKPLPSASYSAVILDISELADGACGGISRCCLFCCCTPSCPSMGMLLPIACGELSCCGSKVKLWNLEVMFEAVPCSVQAGTRSC
jgi:hypothetical protein